jgi:CheY-like chemotaxis protein
MSHGLAGQPDAFGMPGVNGYEVARQLREHRVTRSSVLVAVTGYVNADDHDRSRKARFDHPLAKPVDFESQEAGNATVATNTLHSSEPASKH